MKICETNMIYTLPEAQEMVPLITKITSKHENNISKIMSDQRFLIKCGASQERVTECDNKVGQEMAAWGRKLFKLGLKVMNGGWVGFNNGTGYWLWHYGEKLAQYHCGYGDDPVVSRRLLVPNDRVSEIY